MLVIRTKNIAAAVWGSKLYTKLRLSLTTSLVLEYIFKCSCSVQTVDRSLGDVAVLLGLCYCTRELGGGDVWPGAGWVEHACC